MHACTRGLVPSMVDHRGGGGIDKSNATARTLDGNSTGNGAGFHRFQKVWLPIIFDHLSPPRETLSSTWTNKFIINPVVGVVNQDENTFCRPVCTRPRHFVFIGKQGRFGSRVTRGCRGLFSTPRRVAVFPVCSFNESRNSHWLVAACILFPCRGFTQLALRGAHEWWVYCGGRVGWHTLFKPWKWLVCDCASDVRVSQLCYFLSILIKIFKNYWKLELFSFILIIIILLYLFVDLFCIYIYIYVWKLIIKEIES